MSIEKILAILGLQLKTVKKFPNGAQLNNRINQNVTELDIIALCKKLNKELKCYVTIHFFVAAGIGEGRASYSINTGKYGNVEGRSLPEALAKLRAIIGASFPE